MNKKSLGQFYTTNYEYILQNIKIPKNVKHIIEPFVGNGDLLNMIKDNNIQLELYDIDPKIKNTIKRDTIINPPNYNRKFVLTNPPFLARNKNDAKEIYDNYGFNDLYKCFIITIINSLCYGGIIIIPLNFFCSIRKNDKYLRELFFKKFTLIRMNIFEEKVFDDTNYCVCSILFMRKKINISDNVKTTFYPSNKKVILRFTKNNNYTIGSNIYKLPVSKEIIILRATKNNYDKNYLTNILFKSIDDNEKSKLGFFYVSDDDRYIDETPKLSARTYATLIINKKLTKNKQIELINYLNNYISEMRKKYNSLFLPNYRESNTIARKRMPFELAFRICNFIMVKYDF